MLGKLKLILASLFIATFTAASYPSTTYAQFNFFQDTCRGQAANSPACKQNAQQRLENENPIVNIIRIVANVAAVITGLAAVIMIILGAFNLITSGGNAETVGKGRRRIIFSLVGVAVVALAWTITRLITDRIIQ